MNLSFLLSLLPVIYCSSFNGLYHYTIPYSCYLSNRSLVSKFQSDGNVLQNRLQDIVTCAATASNFSSCIDGLGLDWDNYLIEKLKNASRSERSSPVALERFLINMFSDYCTHLKSGGSSVSDSSSSSDFDASSLIISVIAVTAALVIISVVYAIKKKKKDEETAAVNQNNPYYAQGQGMQYPPPPQQYPYQMYPPRA
jgi:hypothetical protein